MTKGGFESKKRLIASIFLNLAITVSEASAGILTGSLALVSDAGHNFSDVLSLILGYAGVSISDKGPNERLTYGYKRAEVLTSLINASVLFIIGGYILFEAFSRFQTPIPVNPTWMVGVGSIALAGNIGSIFLLREGKDESLNLRTVLLHLIFDSLASVGVIVGGVLIFFYDAYIADVLISILIAIMIFVGASRVLKEGVNIIMQGSPPGIDFDEVKNQILEFEEVGSIHDLHIWSLSSKENVLSCHICPSSREIENDEIIRKIEKKLQEEQDIQHVTIQIESEEICDTGDQF